MSFTSVARAALCQEQIEIALRNVEPDSTPQSFKDSVINFFKKNGVRNPAHNVAADELEITAKTLDEYLDTVGKDSVEILHLRTNYYHVGHFALRVGDVVYHIDDTIGVIKENMKYLVTDKYSQDRIYGYVIHATKEEIDILKNHYDTIMAGPQRPYNLFFNNCSLTVCRGLDAAGIIHTPQLVGIDPVIAEFYVSKSDRILTKTVYNGHTHTSRINRNMGKALNRLTIGAFVLAPVAAVSYFGPKGTSYVKDHFEINTSPFHLNKAIDFDNPFQLAQQLLYVAMDVKTSMYSTQLSRFFVFLHKKFPEHVRRIALIYDTRPAYFYNPDSITLLAKTDPNNFSKLLAHMITLDIILVRKDAVDNLETAGDVSNYYKKLIPTL